MTLDFLKKYQGGWLPDKPDSRDYRWQDFFGTTTPAIQDLPARFSWRNKCPPLPDQESIPSCVSCSFAFLQAFNSHLERGFNDLLSWSYIWANLPYKTNYGSTFRDNAKVVQDKGVCEEAKYPKEKAISENFDKTKISQEADENAKIYKIKNYSYVPWLDFKRALFRQPIIVAVGGRNQDWLSNQKPIKFCGYDKVEWYHAIVIVGWDENNNWEFANWWGRNWGENGYGWLENGYPFESILSVEDIPDYLIPKKYMIIKAPNKPDIYLVIDGKKYPIATSKVYQDLFNDPEWRRVKIVSEEELNSYPTGPKIWTTKPISDWILSL